MKTKIIIIVIVVVVLIAAYFGYKAYKKSKSVPPPPASAPTPAPTVSNQTVSTQPEITVDNLVQQTGVVQQVMPVQKKYISWTFLDIDETSNEIGGWAVGLWQNYYNSKVPELKATRDINYNQIPVTTYWDIASKIAFRNYFMIPENISFYDYFIANSEAIKTKLNDEVLFNWINWILTNSK
jgi:hypothetical protein